MSESFDAVGVSASSVSRRFVKESEDRLRELMERPVPEDLVALVIDGINVGPASLITAVGIDSKGSKHALGIAEGTTENSSVAGDLFTGLAERGLDLAKPILFVIDGSVFPTSLGVNPMESIYALASWASDHVRTALT